MLNIQELANLISEKLNIISAEKGAGYVFDIYAEIGKNSNNGHINGVIIGVSSNPMIIKRFTSAKLSYKVELAIPVAMANKNLILIEDIIGEFAKNFEGEQYEFSTGKASFDINYSHISSSYSIQNTTGSMIPLQFELMLNYTDTGVLGSQKIWKLDGMEIPYISESIILEKDGQTNRISKELYNKSIMLSQTKHFKFTIPYDANKIICTTLQADLLNGDFKKTYTLSYYDGVNYTLEEPFTTTVSLFRSGDSKSDGGALSVFDVTFAEVSEDELAPKYTIELFNTQFDEQNERFFDGVEQQAKWYNSLPHPPAVKIKAPTLNTIFTTTQVYDYDGSIYTPSMLANMNMARINEKKSEQSYKTYSINMDYTSRYNGYIEGNGEHITYSFVSNTPIVINGTTYYLSISNGNYVLKDGGGNNIEISNNSFTINKNYYLRESETKYSIIDSDEKVISEIDKSTLVLINNVSIGAYTGLTLTGYIEENVMKYNLKNETINVDLTKRDLTKSVNSFGYNGYWYVEPNGDNFNVWLLTSGMARYDNVDFENISIGSAITQYGDETFYLTSQYLITGDNGTIFELVRPNVEHYAFKLNNEQFYMDNAQSVGSDVAIGQLTFYNNLYNILNSYSIVLRKQFYIDNIEYELLINGEIKQILRQGLVFADITNTNAFVIGLNYTITQTSVSISFNGEIRDGELIVAYVRDLSAEYDYKFEIEGITYYVNKVENKYNIYYENGTEIAINIENGGYFSIPTGEFNYYYYNIVSAEIGANNQIILSLKLNTFQTYVINPQLKFNECFINKAHLNRFIDNKDGTVSFDGGVESALFEREEFKNVSKRLVNRKVLNTRYGNYNPQDDWQFYKDYKQVEEWLQKNVVGWMYAFLPKGKIKSWYIRNTNVTEDVAYNTLKYKPFEADRNNIDSNFIVFCCPLYSGDNKIILKCNMPREEQGQPVTDNGVGTLAIDLENFYNFLTSGAGVTAYSVKFSKKPPYSVRTNEFLKEFKVDSYGNLVSKTNDSGIPYTSGVEKHLCYSGIFIGMCGYNSTINISGETCKTGILYVNYSDMTQSPEDYEIVNPIRFYKNNNQYVDKVFYAITAFDLAGDIPTFEIPRPNSNVMNISIRTNYNASAISQEMLTTNITNTIGKKTTNINGGVYEIDIRDSVIVFKILQKPSPFLSWNYIQFSERIFGIVGALKNPIFNPKLLNSDYRSLTLTNERGSKFDYDIQKLNTEVLKTEITEALTADMQRTYFRAKDTDGVYQLGCEQNLTGLVEVADTNIPISNEYVAKMLAEQPNYFNQRNITNFQGIVQSGFSGVIGGALAGASVGGLIGAGVGVLASAIPTVIGTYFTDDNMNKQANIVQNANGNVIFNLGYTKNGQTIEQYALLPQEEKIINDQMFANGYVYNRIDNLRNFMHTRKYFNTIVASVETISGLPLSNEVRNDIKQRFANGIRMWHTDDIQYELENYELWLEE